MRPQTTFRVNNGSKYYVADAIDLIVLIGGDGDSAAPHLWGGATIQIAYYQASIADFIEADENAILGTLAQQHSFALEQQQKGAWLSQIRLLKPALGQLDRGHIFFEFRIPLSVVECFETVERVNDWRVRVRLG